MTRFTSRVLAVTAALALTACAAAGAEAKRPPDDFPPPADKPDFAPDAGFAYNNSAYFLAGEVVAKVSGQSLDAFLRETSRWLDAGVLELRRLECFALFPYTEHVETLAVFARH